MKTALITVEPLDDLAALEDKIAWAKAPRALLLWPRKGCAVQRTLDFVRLKRIADRLGTQIAIVTRSRRVRRLARQVGIPVFPNRRAALQKPWRWRRVRRPRPRRRRVDLYTLRALAQRPLPWTQLKPWQRLAAFTAGVLAVLALAAFMFPSAQITLQPENVTQTASIRASISPSYQAVTLSGHLPARWETVTVGASLTRPTTGQAPLPERPAHAEIVLTNLTTETVAIPAGTTVRSVSHPDVAFRTTEGVTLLPEVGAAATVEAESLVYGEIANRPAHDLQVLEAPLAFRVAADNPSPAEGGASLPVPAPSARDYRALEQTLRQQLRAQALDALQKEFPNALIVLPSLQVETDLERTFDPPKTQPANTLSLTLRVRYRALLVAPEDVRALARTTLTASAPHGMVLVPETLKVEADPAGPQGDATPYTWVFHARGVFASPIDQELARQAVVGLTPEAAQQRLDAVFPLATLPEIRCWPAWWPRLPFLPLRITVQVQP